MGGTQKISMWLSPMQAFMMSAVVALIIWACPCLAELTARQRVEAASQKLGSMLPGGAVVTTSWKGSSESDLSITVEQVRPPGSEESLPVFRCESDSLNGPMTSQSACM